MYDHPHEAIGSHDLRQRITELFEDHDDLSASEIATLLGVPLGKVAYHVRVLVNGAVLAQTGERQVRGALQRFYGLA